MQFLLHQLAQCEKRHNFTLKFAFDMNFFKRIMNLVFQPLTTGQLVRAITFFVSYSCVLAQLIMSFFVDQLPALPPRVSRFSFVALHVQNFSVQIAVVGLGSRNYTFAMINLRSNVQTIAKIKIVRISHKITCKCCFFFCIESISL